MKALFLISSIYTLGMFITTPLMVYGLILKGICPIFITFMNEGHITNTTYLEIKKSGLLETMSLDEAYAEFKFQQLEDVYFIFND